MLRTSGIALLATIAMSLVVGTSAARARVPVTPCDPPAFDRLCRVHGYFNLAPYRYSLALYPGCIRTERVLTPHGVRYQRVLVCPWP